MFREKGETQISAHIGSGDDIDQNLQFQLASALNSRLSVFGSLYSAEGGFNKDAIQDESYGRGWQYELALGYYKTLTPKISYEIYGGLAQGDVTNHYSQTYTSNTQGSKFYPAIIKNDFVKPFIQGNFGRRSNKFDFVFNIRVGYLHIYNLENIRSNYTDTGFVATTDESVDNILSNPNSFILEPGVTFRFGYDPLKFQIHVGQSVNLNQSNYPQENGIISLGIVGKLNFRSKK